MFNLVYHILQELKTLKLVIFTKQNMSCCCSYYELYSEGTRILPEIYVSTLIGRNSTRKQTESNDTKK